MKTTGINILNFPTGKKISYTFESRENFNKNYSISFLEENSPKFRIKVSGNCVYDYNDAPIDYIKEYAPVAISGNIYNGQHYDLYYKNKLIALQGAKNFNYINKFMIDSKTDEIDFDFILQAEVPDINLNYPTVFDEYSEIPISLSSANNSIKIYSASVKDVTPAYYPKIFDILIDNSSPSSLPNLRILASRASQQEEYRPYNLQLDLDTNLGFIRKEIFLSGKNTPLTTGLEIVKILDILPENPLDSGEALYSISSNILSGSSDIVRNINVSFSYHGGITGSKNFEIIGTGIHNIIQTGFISGSGVLISNPAQKYSLTGFNPFSLTNTTGEINSNSSSDYVYQGFFDNNLNILGTGLERKSFVLNKDLFATGSGIISVFGSGILDGSGFLTGIQNNMVAFANSDHLISSGEVFNALRAPIIFNTDVSGRASKGYIEEFQYFTGNTTSFNVNDYFTTGLLTGKNETLFIYSGNNISGTFTGNLTGQGILSVIPVVSPLQNFTGYLSGDLSRRSIPISMPFSGASISDYFTGYNQREISVNFAGNALGYDPLTNNSPVIATVTGSKTITTGINYEAVHSGVRYIVVDSNLINQTPIQMANYKFNNNFNASNINSSYFINNIFSNRLRTVLAITSSVEPGGFHGVNNIISFYTGFNNQWNNIWNMGTGYTGPAYNSDPNVFGAKIAFDYSGNNIIVGCDRCDDQYSASISQGQVFTYTRNNNQIITGSRITLGSPYNSYRTKSRFGFDIDIDDSGNSLIVGAPSYRYCTGQNNQLIFDCLETNVHPSDLGAAFLYTKQNNSWVLETGFQPTNITGLNSWAQFGHSVAINKSGNLVAITSLAENQNHSGALYIYEKNGNSWNLSHKRSGIYGGGRRVEFDKNSNILVYHNGIPREWGSDWAWVNNGSAIIDSIAMIENKTGSWDNVGSIYTGATSTINNFTITDSSKLVIIHTGQAWWMQASPLGYSNIGYQTIRSNESGGQLMDIYTVPGRTYVLRSGPSPSTSTNPIVAQISPATGYRSTFNSSTPFGQFSSIGETRLETPPKFLIYNISGNYETEITGDSNFTTIDTQDSYFVSNDLTNYIAISGDSSNLIQAVRNRDFVKNMRADYSHLGLKASNIAFNAINDWTPVSNFNNFPATYTLFGTGFISKNITGNFSGLTINNKQLLDFCSAPSNATILGAAKIQEIDQKLFTGLWSGIGLSNKINKNLTFFANDSGVKTVNETQYSVPYTFYPATTLNSLSYISDRNPSGLFSGDFSGIVLGSGYVERQISGFATGSLGSGQIATGLDFITGNFNANITGSAIFGLFSYNSYVFGFNQNNIYLTGFISELVPTGIVSITIPSQEITGYLPTTNTYNKTFKDSFFDIKTGLRTSGIDMSLNYNNLVYTGNIYNLSSTLESGIIDKKDVFYLKILKQKFYDSDPISGVLNIRVSDPDDLLIFSSGEVYEVI